MTMTATKPVPARKGAPALSRPASVEEKEEVVVEPDLPVEPDPKAHYNALLAAMGPDEPVYVAGNRAPRLKVGDYTLSPGDVVPGAYHWSRRETYERLGRIERRG